MEKIGNTIIHEVGDKVTYKSKPYVIVTDDFDCGGNLHVLGIVRSHKFYPAFLRVKYVDESMIEDLYQPIK